MSENIDRNRNRCRGSGGCRGLSHLPQPSGRRRFGTVRGMDTYTASFRSAEGIGVGTDVRLAGVKVGAVLDMKLDPQTFRANTVFSIQNDVSLPDDTAVIIASEGSAGWQLR